MRMSRRVSNVMSALDGSASNCSLVKLALDHHYSPAIATHLHSRDDAFAERVRWALAGCGGPGSR